MLRSEFSPYLFRPKVIFNSSIPNSHITRSICISISSPTHRAHSNSEVSSQGVACSASYIDNSQGSRVLSRGLQWVALGSLAATPVRKKEAILCTKSVERLSVFKTECGSEIESRPTQSAHGC